jgi:ubiquinone/menaquinone biosynthesis C-methylase UbiE
MSVTEVGIVPERYPSRVSTGTDAAASFDRSAADYDRILAPNRLGAARLAAAMPPPPDGAALLDVGCGTGFTTEAVLARHPGVRRVTGVDPAEGMLAQFRAKAPGLGVELGLHRASAEALPVDDAAFDAVVSGMAFHWFPDKPGAVREMARAARPGGTVAILASGRGSDREFQRVLAEMRPRVPEEWVAIFDLIHRDGPELAGYLEDAGLEPLDVWEEHRVRRVPVEAYLARILAVASHLMEGMDPERAAAEQARVTAATEAAAGPRGFEYRFVKLYGVARRP